MTAAGEPRGYEPHDEREPPPVLGTWPRAYALVIGALALAIALLGLLTRGCA